MQGLRPRILRHRHPNVGKAPDVVEEALPRGRLFSQLNGLGAVGPATGHIEGHSVLIMEGVGIFTDRNGVGCGGPVAVFRRCADQEGAGLVLLPMTCEAGLFCRIVQHCC